MSKESSAMDTKNVNKKGSNKKKFVPLEMVNQNPLVPGRQVCGCEASQHALLNNCLNCGRIVCEQEGTGPCFTCQNHVYYRKEQLEIEEINFKIAELEAKEKKEMKNRKDKAVNLKEIAASLSAANEHKERLLEFDRNCEKRTKVIDDEFDYFNASQQNWMTEGQRAEVKAKADQLHQNKFVKKTLYHVDLDVGAIVATEKSEIENFNKEIDILSDQSAFKSDYEFVDFKEIMDKEIELHPYYVPTDESKQSKANKQQLNKNMQSLFNLKGVDPIRRIRLQDSDLMSVHDEGFCLSIQQPHASHSVYGIKLHEGRKWFTPYRGRLWIHASAKSPRKEEIQEAQQFFKLYNHVPPKYPKNYHLNSLLGCVELVDCLPQDQYRAKYANGYCDDDYVLIFDNPILLKNFIPASAQMKIFKLDEKIHKAALNQLKL